MSTECFRIGNVVLNAGTQEVTRNGEAIPLPPLSFNLLLVLARHAPNVVTIRQLEEEVWSGLLVDRGTINKRVLLVRNALRDAGCSQNYITVVRGTGCRLSAPVERLEEAPETHPEKAASVNGAPGPGGSAAWRPAISWALLIAAVIASFAVKNYDNGQDGQAVAYTEAANNISQGGATYSGERPSLAVLPFEDLSESRVDAFLGDGIAREVINLLASARDLQVASSTSSFAFRDPDEPVASVAAQLGVKTVLRGSVQRFGDRIHVVTRLIDSEDGSILWSASYGGSLDEVFLVQDEIASNVAMALQVVFDASGKPDSRLASTQNVEAFTHFLKGRSLMDNRISRGADGLRESLAHFQSAIELDGMFDRAHVGMASIYYLLPAYDPGVDFEQYLALAEASARYALELNPASSEALGVLGAIMFRRGEPAQSAALFRRATEMGNSDPNILHWDALLFTSMGYFDELVPRLEEAFRLDPLNPLLGCSLAGALNLSGQPESSLAIFSSIKPFSRRDVGLALASMYLGDYQVARELLREVELWTGVLPAEYADLVVTAIEDPLQFDSIEAQIQEAAHTGVLDPLVAFEALLILGTPAAFDLEVDFSGTPFEYRLPEPVWNNWGHALRRDPRFKNWVRALGYEQYWRKNGWPDRCRPTSLEDFECV